MPVRLKDIAGELGLSVVTVSKVLRNHPDIGETTRNKVLKRMKELNYQPNLAARSLSTGRTCTVGLVVPDLLHPFFSQIATSLSAEVRKQRYSLLISSSEDDPELEKQEIEQLLARRVDVLLIASAQLTLESFHRIEEQKVPYVLLDRKFEGLDANFVGVDDQAVGYLATSHLIEQGCQRIAHIRGPAISTAEGRVQGYKNALAAQGLQPLPGFIVSTGASGDHWGERGGYECAKQLLAGNEIPDGIFCFNDPVALGAMRAILEAGLRIPEDIAVVGCGNLSYSDFLRVPLSTVDQNSEIIGQKAAALSLNLALNHKKKVMKTKTQIITPTLIVRASSQRLPKVQP
jgi:LacI family transcriptional regulator